MEIGVTATQRGMTRFQKEVARTILIHLGARIMHNGWCIGGDYDFACLAVALQLDEIVAHQPENRSKMSKWTPASDEIKVTWMAPLPYLERNHNIVRRSTMMLAAPGETTEQLRSGTWATIRFARSPIMRRPIYLIYPDGTTFYTDVNGSTVLFHVQ